jgi:hypothetical protein
MEQPGFFCGDLIIQSALRAGIEDVKANPWLLDYLFNSILSDPLVSKQYGKKVIDTWRKWIVKTDVPVMINARLEEPPACAITINLVSSNESDNTLGDIHHDPTEDIDGPWDPLCAPFTPISWTSGTGELVLPDSVTKETYVFTGMNVVDKSGGLHEILETYTNDLGQTVVTLAEGTIADFTGATIKSKSPPMLVHLESVINTESYLIGCHCSGEAWQTLILWSLTKLVLYRYRQAYLEARGFQISNISSTDFSKNQNYGVEQAWSRYISLGGKTQDVWPKARLGKVQGLDMAVKVIGGATLPPDMQPVDEQAWMGEEDTLDFRNKR